ncbi:MAG TPA: ABC transporter substrate-binding protein [Rhizomicrobium sp.]|nr:ABC transporter substrate-binding protein [Rhizomicrobium sp.]
MSRFRHVAAGIALWLLAVVHSAQAQPGAMTAAAAEDFVRTQMETGLSILNDQTLPLDQRRAHLRALLDSFMDSRRIALFSLGFARHSASPQQVEEFVDVFRSYVLSDLESLLTRYYSGQTVRIAGSIPGPDGYNVDIALENRTPAAQGSDEPTDVIVRVVSENGRFVVADVAALGIWLGNHERDAVKEYLFETNGNFHGLVLHYRLLAKRNLQGLPGAPQPAYGGR